MAYIIGVDRNQIRMITTSLDALIDENNSVRVIDAYADEQINAYLMAIEKDNQSNPDFKKKLEASLSFLICLLIYPVLYHGFHKNTSQMLKPPPKADRPFKNGTR